MTQKKEIDSQARLADRNKMSCEAQLTDQKEVSRKKTKGTDLLAQIC